MPNLTVEHASEHVAVLRIQRPPANFFDTDLISTMGDALDELAAGTTRVAIIGSQGKHFCAGADFNGGLHAESRADDARQLYTEALRLFRVPIPIVAEVQGAAVGGGLGLACAADFRIASPSSTFHANFARLGFHQGFGLSVTLPRIVGLQRAAEMLYLARRVKGEEAERIGLADRCVPEDELHRETVEFASEIAASAPLAVRSIKRTMQGDLAERLDVAIRTELSEQRRLWETDDCTEGVAASFDRRIPVFGGR